MFRVYFAASRLAFMLIGLTLTLWMLGRWLGWILNPADGEFWTGLRVWLGLLALVLVTHTLVIARVLAAFDSVQVVPDRVRQALDALAEGLLVLDERETIVLANEAFTQTVGISATELTGRPVSSLPWVTDEPAQDDDYPWRRATDTNQLQSDQLMRYRDGDKVQRIFSINAAPIQAAGGRNRGTLVTLRDVTKLEGNRSELKAMLAMIKESRDEISRKNRELEILATQDALTGCFNRRAFLIKFERAFRQAQQSGQPLACLMVDNDHFKSVNDTYGHHVGDEVLRRVGELLRRLHQGPDVVCRFGGEEFCIMLPGYKLARAAAAAETIRQEIAAIRMHAPADLRLSASVGVADLTFGAADPQALMNQADSCLYEAKRRGRNRVIVYDSHREAVPETPASGPAGVSAARGKLRSPELDAALSPSNPAVKSLCSALAFRDADTAEHCRRVADHCVRIARGLLDERAVVTLEVAALLHDIGKIGVPDHILLKPGSLSEDEWKLMSLHDQMGVEIVEHLFASPELLEIIRFHHCYFGGGGRTASCPVGQQIPLAARILAVADSYDAMVAERVYRRGMNHRDAIAELRRCCGSQFDPRVVQRFIETFSSSAAAATPLDSVCSQQQWLVHFGKQVDRLAAAVAAQDSRFLKAQAGRLQTLALARNLDELAAAAGQLETRLPGKAEQWGELRNDAQALLRRCRDTQDCLSDPQPAAAWGDAALAHRLVTDRVVVDTVVTDRAIADTVVADGAVAGDVVATV